MSTPETPRGSRASIARLLLAALSLLVIGAVIGIALDRHLLSPGRHNPAAAMHEMTMSALERRLDLSPDQRRQIDSIVAARHHTLRLTWQALHTQLGAAVDTLHDDIELILTPEQRAAFRDWLREGNTGQ